VSLGRAGGVLKLRYATRDASRTRETLAAPTSETTRRVWQMANEARRGNPETGRGWSLPLLGTPEAGRRVGPLEREQHPKASGESDHLIELRDGRADHRGKEVTVIRTPQRPLAPDNVGPENAEPTVLRAISITAGTAIIKRTPSLVSNRLFNLCCSQSKPSIVQRRI